MLRLTPGIIVLTMFATAACSQSRLPPCPSDNTVTWTNCFGTHTWPKGDQYVGEFQGGKFNGYGTKTSPDGSNYAGEWRNGTISGFGTFTWPNGSNYVDEFRDSQRSGRGLMYDANGSVIQSETWSHNEFTGPIAVQGTLPVMVTNVRQSKEFSSIEQFMLSLMTVGTLGALSYWVLRSIRAPAPLATGASNRRQVPTPYNLKKALETITVLETQISRLRQAGKTVMDQRDAFKQALAARERLGKQTSTTSWDTDSRYGALKKFLAQRFHPDQAPGSGIERLVRTEVFKEVWEEINRLDNRL